MSGVQDGNWAPVPKPLFDALLCFPMSDLERRVTLCVVRFTWGHREQKDSRLASRFVAEKVGEKYRGKVSAVIKSLVGRRILVDDNAPTDKQPGRACRLRVNENLAEWRQTCREIPDTLGAANVSGNPRHVPVGKSQTPRVGKSQTPSKDTLSEDTSKDGAAACSEAGAGGAVSFDVTQLTPEELLRRRDTARRELAERISHV